MRTIDRSSGEGGGQILRSSPVGDCLADQLLLPLALTGGGSYLALSLTRHAATNIEVIRQFREVHVTTQEAGPDNVLIEVRR